MPQPSDSETPKSDYPELKLPPGGFQSNIPEHLLRDASPADRWLMEEMSKNTQATEFCVHAAVNTNDQVRRTNGRLKGAEQNIINLKKSVDELQDQMRSVKPIVGTVGALRNVFSYKISWIILGLAVAFLLGLNRETVWKVLQYFFAP